MFKPKVFYVNVKDEMTLVIIAKLAVDCAHCLKYLFFLDLIIATQSLDNKSLVF